jgi:hypothetical protein
MSALRTSWNFIPKKGTIVALHPGSQGAYGPADSLDQTAALAWLNQLDDLEVLGDANDGTFVR